jgi:hypothetical protein
MLQHRQQVIEGHSSKEGKKRCLEPAREGEIQVSQTDSTGSVMHMDLSRREERLLERAPEQKSSQDQEEEQEGISWLRNGKRYYLPADLGI